MLIVFSVFYILIAAAMIVLILMQRGEGANAGASFGGGSSGTVFGARGSANFMSRATGILAGLFFVLSLGMGIYVANNGAPNQGSNLGVMEGVTTSAGSAQSAAVPVGSTAANPTTSATAVPKAVQPAGVTSQSAGAQDATTQSAIPSATVPAGTAAKAKTGTTSDGNKQDSSGSSNN